jgi:hypothetical protein
MQIHVSIGIIADRGLHFVNELVRDILLKLLIKHRRANLYYLQANGLVEKTKGIWIGIIGKIVVDQRKKWDEYVGNTLWTYRTAYKLTTNYTLFQLTFGFEAVVPIELEIPSLWLTIQHGLGDKES